MHRSWSSFFVIPQWGLHSFRSLEPQCSVVILCDSADPGHVVGWTVVPGRKRTALPGAGFPAVLPWVCCIVASADKSVATRERVFGACEALISRHGARDTGHA